MSTALTKQADEALPGAPVSTALQVRETIEKLRGQFNVLTPAVVIDHIPAMHRVSFGVVPFGPDDVYGDPKGFKPPFLNDNERAPNKVGLLKLLAAAGGKVISSVRLDDRKDPLVCEFQVTIDIVQLDGNIARSIATKRLDFSDGSAQISAMKDKQLVQQRQMIAELAESKAMNRAIRAALQLKQKYTVQELARPFVIPKLVVDLDMSDPLIRQMAAAKALGIEAQLYGPPLAGGFPTALPAPAESLVRMIAPAPDDDDAPAPVQAGPVSTSEPVMQMGREQQKHLFAVAGELGIKSRKVAHPSGERTALVIDNPETLAALGLTNPQIVVKSITEAQATELINRMSRLVEARQPSAPPAHLDDELPPVEAPVVFSGPEHVCGCPCGCQMEIRADQAASTLESVGTKRCAECFPGKRFNVTKHAGVATLGLPKRPDITAEQAAKWAQPAGVS